LIVNALAFENQKCIKASFTISEGYSLIKTNHFKMMKKKLLLSLTLLSFAFFASAQRTTTLFQKTYKVNTDSTSLSFQSVARAADGGYALFGNNDNQLNLGDVCLIRTDSLGNVNWSINFNTDTTEAATGIRQTPDGGFIMCGWNSPPRDYTKGEMLLLKVDAAGALKWSTQFGGADIDEAGDVAVLNSGDIVVAGRSPETLGGSYSAYFLLTRSTGSPENGQFVRFGNAPASFNSIDKTADGGAIASGYAGSLFQPSTFDPMLVKFNAQGAVVWGKRYATAGTQFNSIVRQTKDLGYITIGQQAVTQPNGSIPQTFYVIKTNSLGDTLWCKAYDTGKFEFARSVADVGDGYIISGYTVIAIDTVKYRTPQGRDSFYLSDRQNAFAMKIDQAGVFKWAKLYGDSLKKGFLYGSVDAADGGATLVGETYAYGNTFGAGFMVHIDKEGNIGAGTGCQIRNIALTTTTFKIKDSTNVVVIESGDEKASNLRRQVMTVIKSDICSGTGLFTSDVADNRLPDNAVKIYPNPVNAQLFVEIDKNTEGSSLAANLTIFDATGRQILTQKNVNDALQIDVSNYARGIYILKVERGGKYLTKKFIVE
jgi:hypothetical protein